MRRDLGDFQTPPDLVTGVLRALGPVGELWPRVLEPTCGRGNFIAGLLRLDVPPQEIQGLDVQVSHVRYAARIAAAAAVPVRIHQADLFTTDLRRLLRWKATGPLLVVGNPPWVTNAELGSLGSANRPPKTNLKGLRGIDARTGSGNFDIAESIWLKLIRELGFEHPTIALLCKTSVARNVVQFAHDQGWPVSRCSIRRIEAARWFGTAVDACLFRLDVGVGKGDYEVLLYPDLEAGEPESVMGFARGHLVADWRGYERSRFADGVCPMTWRQGIKHDAASVMELTADSGICRNRLGEPADVEPEYVFPLLKSADLFRGAQAGARLLLIVPQRRLGEDMHELRLAAPKLWQYLSSHAEVFERRKSSIYRGMPRFAIFGIGDYCFAPYKVAVSGLHKTPRFRPIGPVAGRPVMLDDTCYYLPCHSPEQAALLAAILNNDQCLGLIRALAFRDSKRPITKRLLQRLDLKALLAHLDRPALLARAEVERQCLASGSTTEGGDWPSSLEDLLIDRSPASAGQRMLFAR